MENNKYEFMKYVCFEDEYIRSYCEQAFKKFAETVTFNEQKFFNKCQSELCMFTKVLLLNLQLEQQICTDGFLDFIISYSTYCLKNYNALFELLSKTGEQDETLEELLIRLAVFFKIIIRNMRKELKI